MKPRRTKLNIQIAHDIAEKYCVTNKLSVSKLKEQRIVEIGDSIIFAQPINKTMRIQGLTADKATQPKPTLVLRRTGAGYKVEETEHTKLYLR